MNFKKLIPRGASRTSGLRGRRPSEGLALLRNPALAIAAVTIAAIGIGTSCSDAVGPTGRVVSVRLNLSTEPNLLIGETLTVHPVPLDAAGQPLDIICIKSFSSDKPGIASVDQDGVVTGVSAGTAIITAKLNNVPQSIPVVVIAGGSLVVTPGTAAVGVGAKSQFTATLRNARNAIVTGKPVTWESSNPSTATVNSQGLATGVSAGTVTITATSDGKTGSALLTVAAAGAASISVAPEQSTIGVGVVEVLTATVRDGSGNVLPNREVTWVSSDPAVATVTSPGTTADVRGVSPGSVTITATSEGKSATAAVTVSSSGSGSISVSPSPLTLGVGATAQLNTEVRDAGGNVVAGAAVTFSSSEPGVAGVSGSGLVTGNAPGVAVVTVSSGGSTATVPVTVVSAGVGSVSITPGSPSVCVGQSTQLTATVRDASGNVLTGRSVTFTSSNDLVARVTSDGLLTGVAAGTANITATSEGQSTTVQATICVAAAISLTLEPAAATVAVGANVQLIATLRDAGGDVIAGRPITFSSSNAATATVDANGRVTGVTPGSATITATSEGKTATSLITVVATPVGSIGLTPSTVAPCVGETAQLTAIVRDADGNVLTGRSVTFSSSAPLVASVDANGLVTGLSAGTATITATSEGKTATAQASICLAAVATLDLTPATATIAVGANAQLVATLRDGAGNVLTGRPVTFTTSDAAVATVDANGKVTGVGTGTATITAASEGKTDTSLIIVVPKPVATIEITPSSPSVCVGQSTQLTAILKDSDGNILTGRSVSFQSSNNLVATVSANGMLTGVSAGTATITATSEGKTTAVQASVCLAAVASLDLEPATATIQAGANTQLVATLRDGGGNILTGRPVTFSTSDAAVATVDANGKVTGVGAGTATITATSEGKSDTSLIIVVPKPVATVEITPPNPSVCVGQSTQLSAVVKDADGNILTGRSVNFQSSNNLVATVTSEGLLTGVTAGTATITATSEGKSTTAQASICLAAVASVTLEPATANVKVGATTQLAATVRDNIGNILTGRPVTFTSSNNTVATVAADGTVLGITPGTVTITATSEGKSATSTVTVTLL